MTGNPTRGRDSDRGKVRSFKACGRFEASPQASHRTAPSLAGELVLVKRGGGTQPDRSFGIENEASAGERDTIRDAGAGLALARDPLACQENTWHDEHRRATSEMPEDFHGGKAAGEGHDNKKESEGDRDAI